MKTSIRLWILLLYCLTGVAAAVAEDTPNLGTGKDAPKPAHHEMSLEVHKTVIQPDAFGQDWNFRLVVIPIIPNMVKVWQGTEKLP